MPVADIQERIGTLVAGKYRLLRMIGEGGMGAVFESEHAITRRRVAVKLIKPEFARSDEVNKRLVQEVQVTAAIGHQNIVKVLDAGTDAEGPYLVLELLEGETLSEVLERRALSPREALTVMAETVDALAAAHAVGVVHRDIKPENIFLLGGGDQCTGVKLLDFGISKILSQHEGAGLTRVGTALGTPDYMSPEQASGSRIDARADLWAVGAVLYEALCRDTPFVGENYQQLLVRIIMTPHVPLSDRLPGIPDTVSRLVDRALQKELHRRFGSADEMLAELRRVLAELPPDEYDAEVRPPPEEATSIFNSLHPPATDENTGVYLPAVQAGALYGSEPPRPSPSNPPPRTATSRDTLITFAAASARPRTRGRVPLLAGAVALAGVAALAGVYLAAEQGTPQATALRPGPVTSPSAAPDAAAQLVPGDAGTVLTVAVDAGTYQALAPVDAGTYQALAPVDAGTYQALAPVDAGTYQALIRTPSDMVFGHPVEHGTTRPSTHRSHTSPDTASHVPVRPVAPPVGPRPTPSARTAPLSMTEIVTALRPLTPAIQSCARGQGGTVVASFDVDERGAVRSVHIDPPFARTPAEACMLGVLRGARFPRGHPSTGVRFLFGLGR